MNFMHTAIEFVRNYNIIHNSTNMNVTLMAIEFLKNY